MIKVGILGAAGYTGGELIRLLLNHPEVEIVFANSERAFLKEHTIPANIKIIDLAQDFRIKGNHDYVYGLPEINKAEIVKAQHVANPGCFATAIQVALLPAAKMGLLTEDVAVNAITGSTGAGQKPGATTHFSWRRDTPVVDTNTGLPRCLHRLYTLSWQFCERYFLYSSC